MLKVDTYSAKGTRLGLTSLPKSLEEEPNLKLLAQAVRVYTERAHVGLASTKTRAEVNRTKKKWYRQKGTGGARHGAKSAPIFVGGGVAHGPRPVRKELSLPKNMAKKALRQALSLKAKNKEVVVVGGLTKLAKTKEAANLTIKLVKAYPEANRFTFVLSEENRPLSKVLRNLKNVAIESYKNLNAFDVFFGGLLILDKEIFNSKSESKSKKNTK